MAAEAFQSEDDRIWAVLHTLATLPQPVGASTLFQHLRVLGWSPSEATVGRVLRDLEYEGAVIKQGRQGRLLTEAGAGRLHALGLARRQRSQGLQLQSLLSDSGYRRVLEVLQVRMMVEGEAAALAAARIGEAELDLLAAGVARSLDKLADGAYRSEDDDGFHNAIARAAGNSVLEAVVRTIREAEGASRVFMQVRQTMGLKSLVDHEEILGALRSRRPETARAAMQVHLQHVLDDVEDFVGAQRKSVQNEA